jgi:hypothetical protein
MSKNSVRLCAPPLSSTRMISRAKSERLFREALNYIPAE